MKPTRRYEDVLKSIGTQNHYGDDYPGRGIDFDTRMRFVTAGGVKYWEHGTFDIVRDGHRNPGWRESVSRTLGVECIKADEFKGDLYTPDGIKIRKSQLQNRPVLWIDREHNLVVNGDYGNTIRYQSEHCPPVAQKKLGVGFRNEKADKEEWPEIKKWFDWILSQKALGGECPVEAWKAWRNSRYTNAGMLQDWVKSQSMPTGAPLYILWKDDDGQWKRYVRDYFRKQSQIIRTYPWLHLTKPEGK